MNNRTRTFLGIVITGLALGWLAWHWQAREPVYQGQPLSSWVQQLPLTWTVSDELPAVKA